MNATRAIQVLIGGIVIATMFVILLIDRQVRTRRAKRALRLRPQGLHVTVTIYDNILPMQRGKKYEKPLDAALREKHLGQVEGGGTQMAADGGVAWVDLEIFLYDSTLDAGIEFTIKTLAELGAPVDSKVKYRIRSKEVNRTLAKN